MKEIEVLFVLVPSAFGACRLLAFPDNVYGLLSDLEFGQTAH